MTLSVRHRIPVLLSLICVSSVSIFLSATPVTASASDVRIRVRRVIPHAASIGHTYDFAVVIGDRRIPVTGAATVLQEGDTLSMVGWVLDWRTMKPGASLRVAIDGEKSRPVDDYGLRRPDVARAVHHVDAVSSGFRASISLAGLAPGLHRIHFSLVAADGSETVLPTEVPISLERRR